jgi:MarR family transcriptional regulator, temperature-dependent positive regulator of motility
MNHDAQQEIHYRLLKLLAEEPQMRQKDMAERMGISVGVVNYCIRKPARRA